MAPGTGSSPLSLMNSFGGSQPSPWHRFPEKARLGWTRWPLLRHLFLTLGLRALLSLLFQVSCSSLSLSPSFSLLLQVHQLNVTPQRHKVFTSSECQPAETTWHLALLQIPRREPDWVFSSGIRCPTMAQSAEAGGGSRGTNMAGRTYPEVPQPRTSIIPSLCS